MISGQGVATCPKKIKAVFAWPVPKTVKDLRSFLGLAGYYRKFVKGFGVIARPLNDLLKKNVVFVWTPDHEVAFHTLKPALVTTHVLAVPDFSKPFYIETDTSEFGVRVVLMQNKHPIAFVSKSLRPRMRGYPSMRKNLWQFCWQWINGGHIFSLWSFALLIIRKVYLT